MDSEREEGIQDTIKKSLEFLEDNQNEEKKKNDSGKRLISN